VRGDSFLEQVGKYARKDEGVNHHSKLCRAAAVGNVSDHRVGEVVGNLVAEDVEQESRKQDRAIHYTLGRKTLLHSLDRINPP